MKDMWRILILVGLVLALVSACRPTVAPVPTAMPSSVPVQEASTLPSAVSTAPTPTSQAVPASTPVHPQPAAGWPMFRFGLDRAGYNPNETTLKPPLALKWEYKTGSKI